MPDRTWTPPSAAVRELLRREVERVLSPEEAVQALAIPLTEAEVETTLELARWFRRRYPTPLERSAYVRRAWRRWKASQPQ